jgi:hypothetical protein
MISHVSPALKNPSAKNTSERLKYDPFSLDAVAQIPRTFQLIAVILVLAGQKCSDPELLNEVYDSPRVRDASRSSVNTLGRASLKTDVEDPRQRQLRWALDMQVLLDVPGVIWMYQRVSLASSECTRGRVRHRRQILKEGQLLEPKTLVQMVLHAGFGPALKCRLSITDRLALAAGISRCTSSRAHLGLGDRRMPRHLGHAPPRRNPLKTRCHKSCQE